MVEFWKYYTANFGKTNDKLKNSWIFEALVNIRMGYRNLKKKEIMDAM